MLYLIEVSNKKIENSKQNVISQDMTMKNQEENENEITKPRPIREAAIRARENIKLIDF